MVHPPFSITTSRLIYPRVTPTSQCVIFVKLIPHQMQEQESKEIPHNLPFLRGEDKYSLVLKSLARTRCRKGRREIY
jgi:hypothetical protein